MTRDDDDQGRRTLTHQLGEALDALSITELDERVELLRAEIARIEAARARKTQALASATGFFKS